LFAFVFSLGCVDLCSHLARTFDGWVPILDFYLEGFSLFQMEKLENIEESKKS